MKAAFNSTIVDGVCTHKDSDLLCGCVTCVYCGITMIQCGGMQERGVHSEPRVQDYPLMRNLDDLAQGPDKRAFRRHVDRKLNELVDMEARIAAGEEIRFGMRSTLYRYVL